MDIKSKYSAISKDLSSDDLLTLSVINDPSLWVESTLRDPDDFNKFIKLRYYQKEILNYKIERVVNERGEEVYKNRLSILRMGRRIGKTITMAAKAIYLASTNINYKIIFVSPFEAQCMVFFNMLEKLIVNTVIIPKRFVRKPFLLELENGSSIRGYTANIRSTKKGSTIRGAEADVIFLDEVDHGADEVINEVIMPIFLGNKRSSIIGASTPTGRRGLFHTWCTDKSLGFKEFYFPASVNPNWTSETEALARKTMTREQYMHEMEAVFGEALEGVFRHKDLEVATVKYTYKSLKYNPNHLYIMGVDWNEKYGVAIVITERLKNVRYRVFWNETVPTQEFTQLQAIARIIELHKTFPCKFLYVDRGFGATQCELLKKHGYDNPVTGLHKIVKDIEYSGNLQVKDPLLGGIILKPAKPYMVNNAQLVFENREIEISEDEDTQYGLIGQCRGFSVKRFGIGGNPIYEGNNNDHQLNALMLSLLGFCLEFSADSKAHVASIIRRVDSFRIPKNIERTMSFDQNTVRFKNLLSRVLPSFKHTGDNTQWKSKMSSNTVVLVQPKMRRSSIRPKRSTF